MELLTTTGLLWADPTTFGSLPYLCQESDHSSAFVARDFHLALDKAFPPQPPGGISATQGSSCYVLPEALSMPSPLPFLGINLDMNLLVQDVGIGPICATGVGLMFDSTLHDR